MSNTVVEKTTLAKGESAKLLKFGVTRGRNGVEVFVQSDILEDFFKRYGLETGDGTKWCGVKPYKIPIVRQHFRELLNQWYGELTTRNGSYPNLSFLRAEGLKSGVKFTMSNNVYTQTEIRTFVKQFKTEVQNFLRVLRVSPFFVRLSPLVTSRPMRGQFPADAGLVSPFSQSRCD